MSNLWNRNGMPCLVHGAFLTRSDLDEEQLVKEAVATWTQLQIKKVPIIFSVVVNLSRSFSVKPWVNRAINIDYENVFVCPETSTQEVSGPGDLKAIYIVDELHLPYYEKLILVLSDRSPSNYVSIFEVKGDSVTTVDLCKNCANLVKCLMDKNFEVVNVCRKFELNQEFYKDSQEKHLDEFDNYIGGIEWLLSEK